MKKVLMPMVLGMLFLFCGYMKCGAEGLLICLHTEMGIASTKYTITDDSKNIAESLSHIFEHDVKLKLLYTYQGRLLNPYQTFSTYEITEGQIHIFSETSDVSLVPNFSNNDFDIVPPSTTPDVDRKHYKENFYSYYGTVVEYDRDKEIKLLLHATDDNSDFLTKVDVKLGDKLRLLSTLFNNPFLVFSKDGFVLNGCRTFGNFGLQHMDKISIRCYTSEQTMSIKYPIEWTNMKHIKSESTLYHLYESKLRPELGRLVDIERSKREKPKIRFRKPREDTKYKPDNTPIIIDFPPQLGEEPLPILWNINDPAR